MILEKLADYTVAVTSRKIAFCKLIKQELINNEIILSDVTIANAVAKLPNDYFITTNEKNNNKITLEINLIPRLLKQNPTMITEVLNRIS